MSSFTERSRFSLPVVVLASLLGAAASAGAVYAAVMHKVETGAAEQVRMERRVDRLEDAVATMRPMLERIDERTATMERRNYRPAP